MRCILIASLATGALSAIIAWASFIAGFSFVLRASVYGWYVFWGSTANCTATALISAVAGWRVLGQRISN